MMNIALSLTYVKGIYDLFIFRLLGNISACFENICAFGVYIFKTC